MHIQVKKVCVPTDFSREADHAVIYGVTMAKEFGAELHLLHVVEDLGPVLASAEGLDAVAANDIIEEVEKSAHINLEKLPAEPVGDLKIVRQLKHGVTFQQINDYAKEADIDLLIVGTHGRTGLKHFLLGSVAERVVRSAPCPVLTIRHPEHEFVVP